MFSQEERELIDGLVGAHLASQSVYIESFEKVRHFEVSVRDAQYQRDLCLRVLRALERLGPVTRRIRRLPFPPASIGAVLSQDERSFATFLATIIRAKG
jgi:hypothetical protein